MPCGQKTKTYNRSNIVANSITTLKMVHIKQIFKEKKKRRARKGRVWVVGGLRKNWNPGLQDLVKSRQASRSFVFALPCVFASFSFSVCSPQHRSPKSEFTCHKIQSQQESPSFFIFLSQFQIPELRYLCMRVCMRSVAQTCQTLCDPMN